MNYTSSLISGRLIKRYKRFLADIILDETGETITAHCANTGAMTGCGSPGDRVWLSRSSNPKRKLAYSWELTETEQGDFICINTAAANRLVKEALQQGGIPDLADYELVRTEAPYGEENSRADFLLQDKQGQYAYMEVKQVTLRMDNGVAAFPDAVTLRGQKHLRELMAGQKHSQKGIMLFIIMRADVDRFRAAHEIDAEYARLLQQAQQHGVQILAYGTRITTRSLELGDPVPFALKAG